jgi:hypothetical protein
MSGIRSHAAVGLTLIASLTAWADDDHKHGDISSQPAIAMLVASGIPGAGAICQVGTFHRGSPFGVGGNPAFIAATEPGAVLNSERLLVASTSNFGAPLYRVDQAPGSVLSIDPNGGAVTVPAGFAADGGQALTAGGRIILYTANNISFKNVGGVARGADTEVGASLPLGISLNSAFGRPWVANAPFGNAGDGTVSVLDPPGFPFAGAPPINTGVFAGTRTNRVAGDTSHGINNGTLATVLVTKSPDFSGRAVFFVANSNGSVDAIHVAQGNDALAPAGTLTPVTGISTASAESINPDDITRAGMVFNWAPTRVIYIADAQANRIVVLDIGDTGLIGGRFTVTGTRSFNSPWLDRPIDLAPTSVEVAARNFASNTTLGAGSDLYVLNRGNNSIVRMSQEGKVMAVRSISTAVSGFRANGIATSPNGRTIWVSGTAPGRDGVVLKMDAFGMGDLTASLINAAAGAGADSVVAQGAKIFSHNFTLADDVGPLFNGTGCASCHNTPAAGGQGVSAGTFVVRFGRVEGNGEFDMPPGGPIAREHSIAEIGGSCGLPTGVPPEANVTSIRAAMSLRGTGLIDNILDQEVLANQALQPVAMRGKANLGTDGRLGRFGWKAHAPTLVEFMGEAMRDELGVTNPLQPKDLVNGCNANLDSPESDGLPLTQLVGFLNSIDRPLGQNTTCNAAQPAGSALFNSLGCSTCHTPTLHGPGSPVGAAVPLYSDLLLHDMGPNLADGIVQGHATGSEFRTAPLWGLSERSHFMHDGRSVDANNAILRHGGQAATAAANYAALSAADKAALQAFLNCL